MATIKLVLVSEDAETAQWYKKPDDFFFFLCDEGLKFIFDIPGDVDTIYVTVTEAFSTNFRPRRIEAFKFQHVITDRRGIITNAISIDPLTRRGFTYLFPITENFSEWLTEKVKIPDGWWGYFSLEYDHVE